MALTDFRDSVVRFLRWEIVGPEQEREILDRSPLPRIYDPSNPMADAAGYFEASNVDIIIEMSDAREAQRSFETNLRMFDQTPQMSQGVFDRLRR